MPDVPATTAEWKDLISEAVEERDPFKANFKITRMHYLLSFALRGAVGREAGANFHSWAVWGSRKAGVTIRQEDRDRASRDATVVAGIVGGLVGLGLGWLTPTPATLSPILPIVSLIVTGILLGGCCGFLLAGYTRSAASKLILKGNKIVLDDIGRQTVRYLGYVAGETSGGDFTAFLAGFRTGATEHGGQELLHRAFQQYENARTSSDRKVQHECTYFANCLAILHEHIRLQPYISRSLPFLIRKCVTQRLMTYSVGEQLLSVHEDVPPLDTAPFPPTLNSTDQAELREFLQGPDGWDQGRGTLQNTRAKDWTQLNERMSYVVNLFRTRHLDDNVVASPYSAKQLAAIADGEWPERPW